MDFPDYGPISVIKAPAASPPIQREPDLTKIDFSTDYTRTYFQKQISRRPKIVPPGTKNPLFVPTDFHITTTF